MQKTVRVSLSDWLALRAEYRGVENPRLFKDRPADEAAWHADFMLGVMDAVYAEGYLGAWGRPHWATRIDGKERSRGSVLQTGLPCGQSTGGLKTPGYSKTVLRTESAAAAPPFFK